MIGTLHGPDWFRGAAILIDIIGIFILVLIASFSLKYYKIYRRGKNYLYLSVSFFLLAISFLFKIFINFILYYDIIKIDQIQFGSLLELEFYSMAFFFSLALFIYRLLTLIGFYILYSIYQKQSKLNHILIIYFIILLTFFNYDVYYLFYFTSLLIMLLITTAYYKKYIEEEYPGKKLILFSFSVISLGQLAYIFISLDQYIYVIAEIMQGVGYLLLLLTFITILFHHGRKKNKA